MNLPRTIVPVFLNALVLAMLCVPCAAQNEIVKNDSAKLLRKVWMARGSVAGGDRVGAAAGWIGDLNKDSIQDFIWGVGRLGQWRVQYGGPTISDTPAQVFELKTTLSYPVVGDFWGIDEQSVGFAGVYFTNNGHRTRMHIRIPVFGIEADTLKLNPLAVFDPAQGVWPNIEATPTGMFAQDLDRDGDDELIVVVGGTLVDQARDARAEVWIFEGGPEFQLDSPTVVLKDDEGNDYPLWANVGDLDGDRYRDIITGGFYTGGGRPAKLKFWWGGADLHGLSLSPDRSITLVDPISPRLGNGLTMLDCDGDKVNDLWFPGPDGQHYLYRMGLDGNDPRGRPFTLADADGVYRGFDIKYPMGSINDSTQRYQMSGGTAASPSGQGAMLVGLSGGADGPNHTYDMFYSAEQDGMIAGNVFGVGGPVGDATGDGWDDYLSANPEWYGLDQGIVLLLAGGPYIPNDDPTVSVREEPIAGESGGLYLWPNPVRDELNIAWKGNLKKMPQRFEVHDVAGRRVASGRIEPYVGAAQWRCADVPTGTYLLTALDQNGEVIASTRVIKE